MMTHKVIVTLETNQGLIKLPVYFRTSNSKKPPRPYKCGYGDGGILTIKAINATEYVFRTVAESYGFDFEIYNFKLDSSIELVDDDDDLKIDLDRLVNKYLDLKDIGKKICKGCETYWKSHECTKKFVEKEKEEAVRNQLLEIQNNIYRQLFNIV